MTERFKMAAVVPVVVLDDAKDAVATAKALLAGGVDVMEITFRTAAAADSIKAVAESWLARARSLRSNSAKRLSSAARSLSFLRALTRKSSAGAWKTALPSRPAA